MNVVLLVVVFLVGALLVVVLLVVVLLVVVLLLEVLHLPLGDNKTSYRIANWESVLHSLHFALVCIECCTLRSLRDRFSIV